MPSTIQTKSIEVRIIGRLNLTTSICLYGYAGSTTLENVDKYQY